MRVPTRRSEQHRKYGSSGDDHLSAQALQELKEEIARLEKVSRPRALEDLTRAQAMGDLSENAAYSEAKGRLRGIDTRLLHLKERVKRAVVVAPGADEQGRARIGATVEVEVNGAARTYEITGSHETDPAKGRISHLSPLGALLIGKSAGDEVILEANGRKTAYRIIAVR
jgi:transcription elongation factor GreA